jgi:hypothetical protein
MGANCIQRNKNELKMGNNPPLLNTMKRKSKKKRAVAPAPAPAQAQAPAQAHAQAQAQAQASSTKKTKASRKIKRKRQARRIKIEQNNSLENTNTENEQQTTKQKIRHVSAETLKFIKRSTRRNKCVYRAPKESTGLCQELQASCQEQPASRKIAMIPVFFLPSNIHLASIPENAEVYRGYFVHMTLMPHKSENRRFSGLMSLSNPDERTIRKTVSKCIDFKSFARSNIPVVGIDNC